MSTTYLTLLLLLAIKRPGSEIYWKLETKEEPESSYFMLVDNDVT